MESLGRSKRRWQTIKEKEYEDIWLVLSGSGYGPVVGFCEYGNERSGSVISVRAKPSSCSHVAASVYMSPTFCYLPTIKRNCISYRMGGPIYEVWTSKETLLRQKELAEEFRLCRIFTQLSERCWQRRKGVERTGSTDTVCLGSGTWQLMTPPLCLLFASFHLLKIKHTHPEPQNQNTVPHHSSNLPFA